MELVLKEDGKPTVLQLGDIVQVVIYGLEETLTVQRKASFLTTGVMLGLNNEIFSKYANELPSLHAIVQEMIQSTGLTYRIEDHSDSTNKFQNETILYILEKPTAIIIREN